MNILIAGGAGFLGSHLCDYLISRGHRVICIDNLLTGKIINIKHLVTDSKFEFKEQDVMEIIRSDNKIDYILHFASPASPIDFERLSLQILRAGAIGTLNLLELARYKKAKFLLASTSEVYGDPLVNPQREDYWGNVNPIGIRSVYDEAKRFAEASTMAYHRKYHLDTKIARIFNTYGPRMQKNDGRAVSTLISQAIGNQPLTIFGDGSQTRSFCYVSDLIEGIYKLMSSDVNTPVNLGCPQEISILDLARTILKITGSKSPILSMNLPENDPKVRKPDIGKAQQLLGWNPMIFLDTGLKKTIAWFNQINE
jgi:dTDP-glucose 4,6-dehydratase